MLKKIYITILAFMFTLTGVFAQDPEVKIHDVTSGPGEITVPVDMLNFTEEVNSFTFKITADEALLDFVEVTNIQGFSPGNMQAFQNGSTLTVTWFDPTGYQPAGHVFDMVFDYTGTANTTLAFQEGENEVTYEFTGVPNVVYTDGVITTTEPLPDPVVKIQDVVADPGVVNVPVEMLNFEQTINSLEFHIEIENETLQFVELDNVVPGLQGDIATNTSGNEIIITWFNGGDGFVPTGQVFDLVFNYTGGFSSDLLWGSGNEVISGATPVEDVGYVQGSVMQTAPPDGSVTLESQEVMTGEQVDMPVNFSGDGFGSVAAFTLKMTHNTDDLNFQGINSAVVDNINVSQNGDEITLQWFGSAQDFTDTDVVNLSFIYTGVSPATVEFQPGSEVNDEAAAPLAVDYNDGTISPQAAEDTVKISDIEAFAGQTVTVPITATDIGDVGAVDFNIQFNNSTLSFGDWDAEQLSGWEFNQNGDELSFAWFGSGAINEGTVINLHFVYDGGGNGPITFLSGSEITGSLGTTIPTSFEDGGVTQATGDSQAEIASVTSCDQNIATVPVTLTDVDPISAFDLEIGFNTDALDFVELQNVNPDITGYNVNTNDDTIFVTWQTAAGGINANGVLFEMVFNYLGSYSEVTFNSGSEFINEIGATLPVQFIDGEVDCNMDQRTLTLDSDGNGSVVVSEDGTELDPDEGTDNQYTVLWGTTLTLEAFGDEGWQFDSWEGAVDDNTANPTTIYMNNDYGVTSVFTMIDYNLDLENDPAEGGESTGAGIYNFQDDATIEAIPNEGWAFVNWTNAGGDVLSADNPYTYTMPSNDTSFVANYEMIDYNVTVTADPAEAGAVTGGGIYNFEDEVTVEATEEEGWAFVNWTNAAGDVVSTDMTYIFSMPSNDVDLTANFEMIDYNVTLSVDPTDAGTVTGGGTYNMDDEVTVTATAATGYSFVNWTDGDGNEVSTDATYVFTMPANDVDLTANFTPNDYNVTLTAVPADGGTVSGGGTYAFGSSVTVDATAAEGYSFVNWTDGGGNEVSTDASYTFDMPANDVDLTANFEANEYNVTLVSAPSDAGTLTGEGTYTYGSSVTVAATANDGYSFVNWTDSDGNEVSTNASYTFDMPANDLELTANFEPNDYTVTVTAEPAEGGSVTGGGTYAFGSSVTVEATPADGYSFDGWTDGSGTLVSSDATYTFDMPANDRDLTAHFEITAFTLTLETNPEEGGTTLGAGNYEEGEVASIQATPNESFIFVNWTNEAGEVVSDVPNFEYTMPASDVTLTANFEEEYTLTLDENPAEGGVTAGGGDYLEGDDVSITATPNEGFVFDYWTDGDGNEVSTDASYNFTMPANDLNYIANFAMIDYTVTVDVDPSDAGSVTGGGTYNFGDDVTVEATPDNGYSFVNWTDSFGNEVSTDATYNFSMPANDVALTANFEANTYDVALNAEPAEGGTVAGAGAFQYGLSVTIDATPNAEDGWFFVEWTDSNGNVVSENDTYTFTMPFSNVEYTAHFDFNTGIGDELTNKDISIYPNPADDRLSVKLAGNTQNIEYIFIYNAVGNQVKAIGQDKISEKFNVNISNLESGVYYLQFKTDSGMVSKKIVVL